MTAKQENAFPRPYRKATQQEGFTADQLIADLRSQLQEQIDDHKERLTALEEKVRELAESADPDER